MDKQTTTSKKRRPLIRSSMKRQILIVCIICTLVALVLQTVLFLNASSSLIYEQNRNESYNSLVNMQNELYTYMKGIEGNMVGIYNNKEYLKALKEYKNTEDLHQDYYRFARDFSESNFTANDGMMALYFYNSKHEIISTYRKAMTPKHNYAIDIFQDSETYNAERVKEYIESGDTQMLISSYYNPSREKDMVRFVLKIYDPSNIKSVIGYIVCDTDVKAMQKIMKKYLPGDEVYVWLQPAGDRPFAALGTLNEENETFYNETSNNIMQGFSPEENMQDSKKVLFHISQTKFNMDAYSIMPQSLLEKNQRTLTRNLFLIAVAVSISMALLYSYITRRLTKPLEELMTTIGRIRAGETELRAAYQAQDEIGQLGHEFNHMLDSMETLIGQQYQDRLLVNKAEYKALQAQINPHFLYNTLDTMSSIASIQNCDIVCNMCQSLSNIFRYSLDIKHPYSTVAREMVHLRNYIFVMDVRMREEVKYNFDIDEEVLVYSIPRISIQPLVENALNHGLKNKHGEKTVSIKAWKEDETLHIMVHDNGIGMDASEMNKKLEENSVDQVEEGNSIGLTNINARLKMVYGTEYGLHIESRIDEGTSIFLVVPAMKEEELYGKANV